MVGIQLKVDALLLVSPNGPRSLFSEQEIGKGGPLPRRSVPFPHKVVPLRLLAQGDVVCCSEQQFWFPTAGDGSGGGVHTLLRDIRQLP